MSFPSIYTFPLVGLSTPPNKCNNVDLPLPLAPIIAKNSPFCTENDILLTAFTSFSPCIIYLVFEVYPKLYVMSLS